MKPVSMGIGYYYHRDPYGELWYRFPSQSYSSDNYESYRTAL